MEELIDVDFQAEPYSLADLSTKFVSCRIWESLNLALEVRNSFDKLWPDWKKTPPTLSSLNNLTMEISNIISQTLNQMDLPKDVLMKIESIILERVEQTFNWTMFLIHDISLDPRVTERIYWGPDGNIDEDRIFNDFWINNFADRPVLPTMAWQSVRETDYMILNYSQLLSCVFAQTDFIMSSSFFHDKQNNSDDVCKIMKLVISALFEKHKMMPSFVPVMMPLLLPNSRMLHISKRLGFHRAFFYFWNCCQEVEKQLFLEELIKDKINYHLKEMKEMKYGSQFSIKIIFFLLKQINHSRKHDFIQNYLPEVIFTFSKIKSFTKFCMPLLKHFLPLLEKSERINLLMCCLRDFQDGNCSMTGLEIFKFLLEKTSVDDKVDALLFNEDEMLIAAMKFMDEFLVYETERNKFKEHLNFTIGWIRVAKFDEIDNLLVWTHGSERNRIKIGLKDLCYKYMRLNSKSIGKLLKWYFGDEKPLVKSCGDKLVFLKQFCCELIYHVWFRGNFEKKIKIDQRIGFSNKILFLVFGSESEITEFKRNELGRGDEFVKFFCENAANKIYLGLKEPRFSIIDEFYNFCCGSASKVADIKKSISNNLNHWIVEYGVRAEKLSVVVPLLEWIFGCSDDNQLKLKNCFENPNKVDLYYSRRT